MPGSGYVLVENCASPNGHLDDETNLILENRLEYFRHMILESPYGQEALDKVDEAYSIVSQLFREGGVVHSTVGILGTEEGNFMQQQELLESMLSTEDCTTLPMDDCTARNLKNSAPVHIMNTEGKRILIIPPGLGLNLGFSLSCRGGFQFVYADSKEKLKPSKLKEMGEDPKTILSGLIRQLIGNGGLLASVLEQEILIEFLIRISYEQGQHCIGDFRNPKIKEKGYAGIRCPWEKYLSNGDSEDSYI